MLGGGGYRILQIEDSPSDALLLRRALQRYPVVIETASDGPSALDRLRDTSKALPGLVLLDLNLPGMSGPEVLAEIRADSRLSLLVVVALTSSRSEMDRERAYRERINAYVGKPTKLAAYGDLAERVHAFWAASNLPPPLGVAL